MSMLGLDIAYMCTKFDHCSSSRAIDTVGPHQNLSSSRDHASFMNDLSSVC